LIAAYLAFPQSVLNAGQAGTWVRVVAVARIMPALGIEPFFIGQHEPPDLVDRSSGPYDLHRMRTLIAARLIPICIHAASCISARRPTLTKMSRIEIGASFFSILPGRVA